MFRSTMKAGEALLEEGTLRQDLKAGRASLDHEGQNLRDKKREDEANAEGEVAQ